MMTPVSVTSVRRSNSDGLWWAVAAEARASATTKAATERSARPIEGDMTVAAMRRWYIHLLTGTRAHVSRHHYRRSKHPRQDVRRSGVAPTEPCDDPVSVVERLPVDVIENRAWGTFLWRHLAIPGNP